MRTITIDIINDKALKLLKELESLQLIKLRYEHDVQVKKTDWSRFKGSMTKQSPEEIDKQFDELRNSWE